MSFNYSNALHPTLLIGDTVLAHRITSLSEMFITGSRIIQYNLKVEICQSQLNLILHVYVPGPGGHMSRYSLSWLAENSFERKYQSTEQPRILWNSDIYKNANITSSKWDTFMSCDDELKKFLQNYLLYGIAFIDDVPTTVEATEAVTQRVSLIRYASVGLQITFSSLR